MSVLGYYQMMCSQVRTVLGTISFVTNTYTASVTPFNSVTTGAINTSAATPHSLIVIGVTDFENVPIGVLTDSKSNTYTNIRTDNASFGLGNAIRTSIYYKSDATVGTGHTFTYTGTGNFPTIYVSVYSCANTIVLDKNNGNVVIGSTTNIQPGAIAPSTNKSLFVTVVNAQFSSTAPTITSPFIISNSNNESITATTPYAGGMAYLIETNPLTMNPTWSFAASGNYAVSNMATFRSSV